MLYHVHGINMCTGLNTAVFGGPYTHKQTELMLMNWNLFFDLGVSSVRYHASPILDL